MRRGTVPLFAVLGLAACNALTGAGDFEVCEDGKEGEGKCAPSEDGGPGSSSGSSGAPEGGPAIGPDGGACNDGDKACKGRSAATCVGKAWQLTPCAEACSNNACAPWPSCRGPAGTACAGKSCCVSKVVPGGTFNRRNASQYPATIGKFELDVYEVSVGRFRAFVQAGQGTAGAPPLPGTGAHPKITGSGWVPAWNALLPANQGALNDLLANGTWTATIAANEKKPITNVPWFVAFAFCAWDGGRLPTYAEWNFAAAGGADQRQYPWSSPPSATSIDTDHAAYSCAHSAPPYQCMPTYCDSNPAITPCDTNVCPAPSTCVDPGCTGCESPADLAPVGSRLPGVGKFGQLDLAGNVAELVLDARPDKSDTSLPLPCNDCATLMAADPKLGQGASDDYHVMFAGGNWADTGGESLRTSAFGSGQYASRSTTVGLRCARD